MTAPSEAGIERYFKKIKSLPTVMRVEVDFNPHLGFLVTVYDERWGTPAIGRGNAHPSLYEALKAAWEEVGGEGSSST